MAATTAACKRMHLMSESMARPKERLRKAHHTQAHTRIHRNKHAPEERPTAPQEEAADADAGTASANWHPAQGVVQGVDCVVPAQTVTLLQSCGATVTLLQRGSGGLHVNERGARTHPHMLKVLQKHSAGRWWARTRPELKSTSTAVMRPRLRQSVSQCHVREWGA